MAARRGAWSCLQRGLELPAPLGPAGRGPRTVRAWWGRGLPHRRGLGRGAPVSLGPEGGPTTAGARGRDGNIFIHIYIYTRIFGRASRGLDVNPMSDFSYIYIYTRVFTMCNLNPMSTYNTLCTSTTRNTLHVSCTVYTVLYRLPEHRFIHETLQNSLRPNS